jgi:hypothetical protein
MRRLVPIVLALVLLMSTTPASLGAPPGPTLHDISISLATTDVSAVCIGTGTPCDGTLELTFSGTVSGQLPFSELKGIRDPQTVTGTFVFPMSTYDSETGCVSGVLGVIQIFVPRGSGMRLAFELDSLNGSVCAGSFSGAFTVDSAETEVRTFRQATGSGQFNLTSDLDFEAVTVSALQIDLSGEIVTIR